MIRKIFAKTLAILSAAAMLLGPMPLGAVTATQDTALTVNGIALKILAGSQYDSLTTTATSLTVTVAADDAFILRQPGPDPSGLENDGGYPACKVISTRDNQILINGPKTVTITPSAVNCSTANYSTDTTPLLSVNQPNGAENLKSGDSYQVFWQSTGRTMGSVRLRLSTDGGATYPTTITANLINNGFYQWTVPTVTTTSQARLKIEGYDQGLIVAMDTSNSNFSIQGTAPPPETPSPSAPATYDYDPAAETVTAATIDDDRGYVEPPPGTPRCAAGSRIKGASSTAVYYCGKDAKRHPFPNQRIHDSWFNGFVGVITLSDEELAKIPLGENVTYRPGVRMIKLQTDPKVYAVAKDGTLRWVPDEWTARAVFGDAWNTQVDDLSDSFFADYTVGERIRQK